MENLFYKLSSGDDIFNSIHKLSKKSKSISFVLSAVGDLCQCTFKCPGNDKPILLKKNLEIISINGHFKPEEIHLHISASDEYCSVVGGHLLPGTVVLNKLDILIGVIPEIIQKNLNPAGNLIKHVDIFILRDCPWSKKAISLLRSYNISYVSHLVTNDQEFNKIKKLTSFNTFPQIFIDDNFIGGFAELSNLLKRV